jgi:hypothetical protein
VGRGIPQPGGGGNPIWSIVLYCICIIDILFVTVLYYLQQLLTLSSFTTTISGYILQIFFFENMNVCFYREGGGGHVTDR